MADLKASGSLTSDDGMLFAFGLCARRTEMAGVPCRRPVVDGESDRLTRESRYCGAHQADEQEGGEGA